MDAVGQDRARSDLGARTKAFALAVIQLVQALPHDGVTVVLGKQLLRAGTPVGANYCAAWRAKSPADFIAKVSIVASIDTARRRPSH